jgi:predicted RNase H-like HicB family nuclease
MICYAIVIEKVDKNYSAYCPDVPGCVTTGDTLEEVRNNMRSALEFHLEGIAEDGEAPPVPTSVVEYIEVNQPRPAKAR